MITLPFTLSVFFPAYNEQDNIESSVRQAIGVLDGLVKDYEIIIVNDGSKDNTGPIADRLAREHSKVRAIHHNPNQGYGGALWTGFQNARMDYVFFTDADLQFDLAEIAELLRHIPEYDAVIGYRAVRRDPFMRLANAKGWNMLNRALFGLKVTDIDCAFKVFKRELAQELPIQSRGAMFSAEMLIRLQRQGVVFKEVPVTHLPRLMGSPTGAKPSVILRAFKEMIQVYRGDLGNRAHITFAKFTLVGAVNTMIDWASYFLLTRGVEFFGSHLAVAKGTSFLIGSVPSFIANKYWTFRSAEPVRAMELAKFYLTISIALAINVTTLYVLVHIFGMYDLLAVIIATALSFAWNFIISRFWVFRPLEVQAELPTIV